jgi:hypothetical protein
MHEQHGLYPHKEFMNCCDGDFIMQLGRAGRRIGHVPALLVDYRYHEHGQSADLRVTTNMAREWRLIREAHGVRFDWWGRCVGKFYRAKRQWQKLTRRGKIDLVSGKWKLRRVMKSQTSFTSNIDLTKLKPGAQ